jgi:phosphoribosylformylglycinamidine synthase
MWPAKNRGENARLYDAVEAVSDFAIGLGINIPTGKDSLSMVQKYDDGVVFSPGTVIISAAAEVSDIKNVIEPVVKATGDNSLIYIDFSGGSFELGGSSLGQVLNKIGGKTADVADSGYFAKAFEAVQKLIASGYVTAGHDVSAGGLVTTLLEMTFSSAGAGIRTDLTALGEKDLTRVLFSEKPAVVIQTSDAGKVSAVLDDAGVKYSLIGEVSDDGFLNIVNYESVIRLDISEMRDVWFKTSYLFDKNQTAGDLAEKRFENYKNFGLSYRFPEHFTGKYSDIAGEIKKRPVAAIIREKGVNGDREMAWSLYHAGFDVRDVHMTDLINGREDLSGVKMIVFVGGFSNSDVLGSAKGWAGAFLYNEKAKAALDAFYAREDTLSLGICNGCQLMVELGLINKDHELKPKMLHNDSRKFESAFLNVEIGDTNSVMLKTLKGSRLGIWVAHGEGKFDLPYDESAYDIPVKYGFEEYPANPNGSEYNAAAICSADGRHLAMMPHLERAVYSWQWADYPAERKDDEATPWLEAFVNARKWCENH